MRTKIRIIATAVSAVGIGCVGLAGCGGAGSSAGGTSPATVSSSSSVASGSPSAAASNTPLAVAREFIAAVRAHDGAGACALVVPSGQAQCNSQFAPLLAQATFSNPAFHQTVVRGDRALVSITGQLCIAGHCQGATDPDSGMPSATLTFDQAWALTKTPSTLATAASPCQQVNGKWYVVID